MAAGGAGGVPPGASLPYNLVWGDSPDRLARALAGVQATVKERRVTGNREVWLVQGLLRAGPKLNSVHLTFVDGALAALEFQYEQPDWDVPQYNQAMGFLRRQLEHELGGPGEMISRQTDPPSAPNGAAPEIRQTLTGYEWKRGETNVQLFYFAAEEKEKALSYRTISIHYEYHDDGAQSAAAAGADPLPVPDPVASPTPSAAPARAEKQKPPAVPDAVGPAVSPVAPAQSK